MRLRLTTATKKIRDKLKRTGKNSRIFSIQKIVKAITVGHKLLAVLGRYRSIIPILYFERKTFRFFVKSLAYSVLLTLNIYLSGYGAVW